MGFETTGRKSVGEGTEREVGLGKWTRRLRVFVGGCPVDDDREVFEDNQSYRDFFE